MGLHHIGKFPESYDEIAGQGCYCLILTAATYPIKKFRRTLSVAEQWAMRGAQ